MKNTNTNGRNQMIRIQNVGVRIVLNVTTISKYALPECIFFEKNPNNYEITTPISNYVRWVGILWNGRNEKQIKELITWITWSYSYNIILLVFYAEILDGLCECCCCWFFVSYSFTLCSECRESSPRKCWCKPNATQKCTVWMDVPHANS